MTPRTRRAVVGAGALGLAAGGSIPWDWLWAIVARLLGLG
jgi:hypothetical protein